MRIPSDGRSYEQFLVPALLALLPGPLLAGAGCAHEAGPTALGTASVPMGAAAVSGEIAVSPSIMPRPVSGQWPAAAFDGTQHLVVWEDLRAGWPILYGARIGADGAALDPLGFPILDAFLYDTICCEYEPAVAFDGESFLVVAEVADRILGVRVSRTGEVLDPDGIEIATVASLSSRPTLIFDGQQYMVAWAQQADAAGPDAGIYWARVRADGTVLDPGGVRGYALAGLDLPVGLSFDGDNYLLTWLDRDGEPGTRAVYGARVAPDGTRIDADAVRISPGGARALVGAEARFDGANHVIAWIGLFDGASPFSQRVMVSRVTPDRTVLDPDGILVATQAVPSGLFLDRLTIAAAGGRSAVTWSIDAVFYIDITREPIGMALVAADGTVSPHPAGAFAGGAQATLAAHPDGALLLWREITEAFPDHPVVMGARLDATGVPGTSSAVVPGVMAAGQRVAGVATDGQIYFVVWTDPRDIEVGGRGLYGARIAADGTRLDPEDILISSGPAQRAGVVFDGASFVVAWVYYDVEGSGYERAVRVSPDGELLDTAPWLLPLSWSQPDFAAASDGTHTLLVGPSEQAGYLGVVLVDQDGEAASEVAHPEVAGQRVHAVSPAVSFDGTSYLVVWNSPAAVFGRLVGADGALLGQSFAIASEGGTYRCTTSTAGGGNHLVVWQDEDGSIFAKRVSPDGEVLEPIGRLITQAADVSSRSCPPVVFDGERFVVAWRAPSAAGEGTLDLYGAELDLDGSVLQEFAISEDPQREDLPFLAAGADGRVLAAYNRFVPGAPHEAQRAHVRLIGSEDVPGPGTDAGPPGPAPDAGGSPADPGPGDGDGCGCRVGADQPGPVASLLLLGVAWLALVRRRSAR